MSITIITAFFDIGRGEWSVENGHPGYLQRSNEKYFKYFENLAKLENEMIIFTSEEYVSKIQKLRGKRKTTIIQLNFREKFAECIQEIKKVQENHDFRSKIDKDQLKNPEYWSPEYVLVNNLKSYFLKSAINSGYVKTELAAWIDFGYCRKKTTLNNIEKWNFNFSTEKVHFFSIKKDFDISLDNVMHAVLNNQPYIIGGVIVASPSKWLDFSKLVYSCQKEMLNNKIVDDDQGVYLQTLLKQPDLFEIHYLGEDQWFDVFKRYHEQIDLNFMSRVKKFLGYF